MTTACYFVGGLVLGSVLRQRADTLAEHRHPAVIEGEIVVGGAVAVHEAQRIVRRTAH